jgi:hypothetical protein
MRRSYMRLIHRITLRDLPERREVLASLGIEFNGPSSPLVPRIWLDIDESNPGYRHLKKHLSNWEDALDYVGTRFTNAEMRSGSWYAMRPRWHWGYPQPESGNAYLTASFDLERFCPACGIGKRQIAPIRLRSEPKWGQKQIMQTNWLFDEFFVRPDAWRDVFRPFSIERIPVIHHKMNSDLETAVQLRLEISANSALGIAKDHTYEHCPECGRNKPNPITVGFYPKFLRPQTQHIVRSQEYFGSGASAWNEIIVSRKVYDAIKRHKCIGAYFIPMAS